MKTETEVILYGAKWCAFCVRLRQFLESEELSYDYRNVDDEMIEAEMLQHTDGRYLIPTVIVDGKAYQNPPAHMLKELIND